MTSEMPAPGLTLEGKCNRIIDGDTVEITVTRSFKVRFLDPDNHNNKLYGCAELHTPEGKRAQNELILKAKDHEVIVHIPNRGTMNLVDFLTFDRVLAEVWLKDTGENLSTYMEEKGYAKKNQKK